ncbi:hypothetical protein ZYGR_0AD02860 [Zygosaccharomyces rouxii]|uniref:ZYRO0G12606p n=2 Tax=Zygosaccharomyces rouxii TaxID=4956 RepID=C5E0G9_ZYGRC|nr:uncharacterized protein ZYRO0G12606g [Zygosaccharomyces rouxii]KAH9202596.1 Dfp1/Him1, central region-domain-containing protein [Zygosaccharomyces rouxii]GAV51103.1 hypothetical protein ZYGR_0AD02860 [Zygosaccharomyces rouxii]CAR29603.1 ZYRO0G12606p [Zygosaccharomyces rouxii]
MTTRSPLKETDANLRQPRLHLNNEDESSAATNKKRALERLETQQQQQRKKPKAERARSIEGAVQVGKSTALKNIEQKVTPSELLEWQNNWKKIMRRESRIYFDTTDESDCSKFIKNRMDKRRDLLKKGFLSLGAQITQFFDSSVTIVITRRSVENISALSDSDILSRAKKNYMKIWGYEKATRFLKNLDVDLDFLEKSKTTSLPEPTLSNLLQNEKLYGPADRDPRTRRDDIHYFKFAHVYMYDLWQTWAPIIVLEWKPPDLADPKKIPYPVLKMGTFGRCPFIGDGACDETSYKRVVKRCNRDKANKKYALRLRLLYQHHAEPSIDSQELMIIPHTCLDSEQCYENWQKTLAAETDNNEAAEAGSKCIWKEPVPATALSLRKPLVSGAANVLTRQETEDFPDDLCNSKKQSRVTQELKASGVHQSNDVATSFGNGLGPTKASVTNRNIKNLSRLVVDRKLGTKAPTAVNTNKITPATTTTTSTVEVHGTGSHEASPVVPDNNTAEKEAEEDSRQKKRKTETATPAPVARRDNAKNSGYCENCRVKYDQLEQHIVSDKHQSFAQNDLNFEMIDSLIDKLKFQF